jgi:hypothetical protein
MPLVTADEAVRIRSVDQVYVHFREELRARAAL